MTTCLGNVCHTLVITFAARKMESVASFFIHDDDDGPSIAHIAVNCSTRGFTVKVCKPLIKNMVCNC